VAGAGVLDFELGDERRDAPAPAPTLRSRVTEAAVGCLARHGILKTTVDDVARQAGVSRATVYRAFPGGREEVLHAVVDSEAARLFAAVGASIAAEQDLSAALVAGIVEASSCIHEHPAVRYLLAHEPGTILSHLAFDEADRVLATSSRLAAPFFTRWMGPGEAEQVAEWATRIVLSYAIAPSAGTDLTDPVSTTRLVETFVMPGIRALHAFSAQGAQGADAATPAHRAHRNSTKNGHHASRSGGRRR
jgi:AcrR family transcriptional regulator